MNRSILVIEDDTVLNALLCGHLERRGYNTHAARNWAEADAWLGRETADLVILDCKLPDGDGIALLPQLTAQQPVVMLTAYSSVQTAVSAVKAGAAEYLIKPINLEELDVVVARAIEVAALKREHSFIKNRMAAQGSHMMVGSSPGIAEVRRLIAAVAPSDMTVLIQGESGAGKELVAQSIHAQSGRERGTFVAVDCCSLQRTLFESELFGHEKGAFTGADRLKKGLIEGAEGGTLFLDEIGEIEPAIQAKLLRVLETGRYRRLGGTKDLSANVRIVAATNRDLESMSRESRFRADLFYRLSAFVIQVPPLCDRRDDIPDLVRHFVAHYDFSGRTPKTVAEQSMDRLQAYGWPGNIRELRNIVERAIILSGDQAVIGPELFAVQLAPKPRAAEGAPGSILEGEPTMEELERRYLKHLLAKYDGHRALVAAKMGISERNIYRIISKFGLD